MPNVSKRTSKPGSKRKNSLGSMPGPSAGKASAVGKPNSNANEASLPPERSSAPLGIQPVSLNSTLTQPSRKSDGDVGLSRSNALRESSLKAKVRTADISANLQPGAAPSESNGKDNLETVDATRITDVQDREEARLGNVEKTIGGRPKAGGAPPLPKDFSLRKEGVSPKGEGIIKVVDFENKIKAASGGISKENTDKQNGLRADLITHLTDYHNEIAKVKQNLKAQNDARVRKGNELVALNAQLPDIEKRIAATQNSMNGIRKWLTDNSSLEPGNITEENSEKLRGKTEELAAAEQKLAELTNQKAQLEPDIKSVEDFINISLYNERNSIQNQSKELADHHLGKISATAIALNDTFLVKSDTLKQLTDDQGAANVLKDLRDAQMEASGGIPFDQQLAKVPRIKDKESANIVYVVETNRALGNPNNHVGYAKMATAKGEPSNVNTNNLGIPKEGPKELNGKLLEHPNMIARSVLSYEVDKLIGIGVTSYETFTRNVDGRLMGISGQVGGLQCEVKNSPNSGIPRETYKLATTQRMLSDLQIMDAITGQTDRHIGNIFINPANGEVSSIDQDQAHPSDNDFLRPAVDNPKFISGTTQLGGQFIKQGNKLVYTQKLIDAGTAEKILKITPEQLRSTLKKQVGGESLPDKSIEAEIERFNAVKARIIELKNQKPSGLITTWDESTFRQLVEGRNGIAREEEYTGTVEVYVQPRFNNYVALGAYTVAGIVAKNDFKVD